MIKKCYICKEKNYTNGKTCSKKCADVYLDMPFSKLHTRERMRRKFYIPLKFDPNNDILKVKLI